MNLKRRLKNDMSVDFSEVDQTMDGVQIVDPNNRYKQPKSKLNESDMGPLALALGNDVSI